MELIEILKCFLYEAPELQIKDFQINKKSITSRNLALESRLQELCLVVSDRLLLKVMDGNITIWYEK